MKIPVSDCRCPMEAGGACLCIFLFHRSDENPVGLPLSWKQVIACLNYRVRRLFSQGKEIAAEVSRLREDCDPQVC